MTSTTPTTRSHILRGATALAVVTALSLGIPATIAHAEAVIGVVDSQAISDIDGSRLVDLTIIKTPGNPFDDGTDRPEPSIEGVTFTVKRVQGVNLTTEAGWATARDITVVEATALGFTREFTAVTNTAGEAFFTGLPIGLYLVSETPAPTPGFDPPEIIDFLITLPTGDNDGESWDYSVHVKAKSEEVASYTPTTPTTPPTTTPTTTRTTTPTEPVASYTPPPRGTTSTTRPRETVASFTPARPGSPGESVASYGPGGRQALASTGANVIGLAAFALILIGGGIFLVMRSRRRE